MGIPAGAIIVTDLNTTLSTNKATLTADGYPIVGGYATSWARA